MQNAILQYYAGFRRRDGRQVAYGLTVMGMATRVDFLSEFVLPRFSGRFRFQSLFSEIMYS
jgi:hypothetical protein